MSVQNKFRCPRCFYETDRTFNLKNHLNRKKVCLPLYSNISIDVLRRNIQDKKRKFFTSNNTLRRSYLRDPVEILNKHECNVCFKKFSRKDSLKRHCENNCKQICMIHPKIEIKKRSYGQENLCKVSSSDIVDIVEKGTVVSGINKLLSKIHFNEETPENCNIRLTSDKTKYAEVFQEGGWKRVLKSDFIFSIILEKANMIDEAFVGRSKKLFHHKFDNKYYNTPRSKFHRDLEKNVECHLLNCTRRLMYRNFI